MRPSNVQRTLCSLPMEILCLVLTYCPVRDIISLRQCSKYIERLTRQRIVWIEALKKLCYSMELCPQSFPVETMSSKNVELAATGHYHFRRYAERHFTETPRAPLVPTSVRSVKLAVPDPTVFFRAVHLIPGGRFLVAILGDQLQLWDLGFGLGGPDGNDIDEHRMPTRPKASTYCRLSAEPTVWIGSFPCTDGTVTVEVTDEPGGTETGVILTLFELTNISTKPGIKQIGRFESSNSTYFSTSPNHMPTVFFEEDSSCVGVWDARTQSGVRWMSEDYSSMVNISPHNILQITRDRLSMDIYEFPSALPPVPPGATSPELISHFPVFTVDWAREVFRIGEPSTIRIANEWVSSLRQPHRFELLCRYRNGTMGVIRKVTKPLAFVGPEDHDGQTDFASRYQSHPRCLPVTVHSDTYDDLPLGEQDCPNSIAFPDGYRMLWWSGASPLLIDMQGNLQMHFSLITGKKKESFGGVMWPGAPSLNCWSVCPTTARLCAAYEREVKVVDFLNWGP